MKRTTTARKLFVLYIVLLLLFVIFKVLPKFDVFMNFTVIRSDRMDGIHMYNLLPLKTIRKYTDSITMFHAFVNLFGNILPFVPFGTLFPMCFKNRAGFLKTVLIGAGFILACEILQDLTMTGYFDIDDIILNTSGIVLGRVILSIFFKFSKASSL